MKQRLYLTIPFFLCACGDGDSGAELGADASVAATPLGAANQPTLGTQIDRTGRPAVNTALNFQFIPDDAARNASKDAWNAASDPAEWAAFVPEMRVHLMVLDALDEQCGDQVAYGAPAVGDEYLGLATILADDQLWLTAGNAEVGAYLGLELGLTAQGGRRLNDDVIDVTYAGLAGTIEAGPPLTLNFGDTIDANDQANSSDFPYLAAP